MNTVHYVHSLPDAPTFSGKGLEGYTFGPLAEDMEVHYIEVGSGHDTFQISKRVTRIYYVDKGSGYFVIDGRKYEVGPGQLIEVPPRVEYSYSGKMVLIAITTPKWFRGNDRSTRWNSDVVGSDSEIYGDDLIVRLGHVRFFGKSPILAFLRMNKPLWRNLPESISTWPPLLVYGRFLHELANGGEAKSQALSTFFLRNRPELKLLQRQLETILDGSVLHVSVLGCSTGPEAYSIAWAIKKERPDLKLEMNAVDIAPEAIEVAKRGEYSESPGLSTTPVMARMTSQERDEFFDSCDDVMSVKPWLRECITWRVADAGDPHVRNELGPQDFVIANNFLCHMAPPDADLCLRCIAGLVRPGGYLFVSGVDLDVRTHAARDLNWTPILDMLEEVHNGDPVVRSQWPCHYAGLEPMDKRHKDWPLRYVAAFRLPEAS